MNRLLAIAAEQFGLFTRRQAHRCGVSDRVLQRRVRNGLLEQLQRGVYRVSGVELSWRHRVLAACLAGGDTCVASHRTAAKLHGFDSCRSEVVEVSVPRSVRYKTQDAIVHQSVDLAACDTTHDGPIPVTTPARTLIDLGAVRRWQTVEEAFDGAERDAIVVADSVRKRHEEVRRQGRNGVGPMAVVLLDRDDAPPKEVIERRFLRLMEQANLPRPQCQYEVVISTGEVRYIDLAMPELLLGWELDGHGTHATRKARSHDHARADEIADLGWRLSRFTFEDVMRDGASVIRRVQRAINSRSCGL